MTSRAYPLSHSVALDDVPEDGLDVDIEATPEQRGALARYLDIPAVERMSVHLAVARWRTRGLEVRGELTASVVQTCVVTLEPVHSEVHEEIAANFFPETGKLRPEDVSGAEAGDIDIEPLVDGRIDVGALACEYLALGLDPYPRQPGVVFEQGTADEAKTSPFAALSALRSGRKDE